MSEQRFKQALILLGLAALVAIGSMFSSIGPSKAQKEELAKAQQQADAELLERRSKSPQYRLERARMVLDRQFPGECGAEAKFTYLSNGDVSVQCSYNETFAVGPTTPAMRCAPLTKMGIMVAACSTP
jgi:hypothetical protein